MAHGIQLLVVERNLPGELDSAAYLQQLAQQISDRAAGQPIRLLGFSIGACLALRVAALLGERVAEVSCYRPPHRWKFPAIASAWARGGIPFSGRNIIQDYFGPLPGIKCGPLSDRGKRVARR